MAPQLKVDPELQMRQHFEWTWDQGSLIGSAAVLQNDGRDVLFSPGFSVGTVALRGTKPLGKGLHHYWEIEMSSEVYGTDMMVGVGTEGTDLDEYSHSFVSLIGLSESSWGLSYTGSKHHGGKTLRYTENFGHHTVIGLHLDMWMGSLEFYINRKPMGVAFTGLQDKVLYPMISSTAARSGMNLLYSRSFAPSLQLMTLLAIGKATSLPEGNASLFKALPDGLLPPGLRTWIKNNFWWITSTQVNKAKAAPKAEEVVQTTTRRGRKVKKDAGHHHHAHDESCMVVTRSTASASSSSSRRQIFAPVPPPILQTPSGRRPVTRSISASRPLEPTDLPPRASSSAGTATTIPTTRDSPVLGPGSKRMCLRSSPPNNKR